MENETQIFYGRGWVAGFFFLFCILVGILSITIGQPFGGLFLIILGLVFSFYAFRLKKIYINCNGVKYWKGNKMSFEALWKDVIWVKNGGTFGIGLTWFTRCIIIETNTNYITLKGIWDFRVGKLKKIFHEIVLKHEHFPHIKIEDNLGWVKGRIVISKWEQKSTLIQCPNCQNRFYYTPFSSPEEIVCPFCKVRGEFKQNTED